MSHGFRKFIFDVLINGKFPKFLLQLLSESVFRRLGSLIDLM